MKSAYRSFFTLLGQNSDNNGVNMIYYALYYNKEGIYIIQNKMFCFIFTHGLYFGNTIKKIRGRGTIFAKITYLNNHMNKILGSFDALYTLLLNLYQFVGI